MANTISDSTLLEISIVDKGASGDGEDRPRIVIAKRDPIMLEDVMAKLSPEDQAVVMEALAAAAAPVEPMAEPEAAPVVDAPAAVEVEVEEKADEPEAPAMAKPEDEDKPAPVEVAKALENVSPEDRNMVLEAIEKRAILEKRVEALEGEKNLAKFTEIAKSMDALPGQTTEARASTLIEASKALKPETYATIEKALRDASEIIAKSAAMGETGSAASLTGEPMDKLQAIAKSLREADPKLTADGAMVAAAAKNPELYKATR